MSFAAQNQIFFGLFDDRLSNRLTAITSLFDSEAGFITQRIDQPPLSPGQFPYSRQSFVG
jgi:hypothetical protein